MTQITTALGGITTIEEHERTTWHVVANAPVQLPVPLTRDFPTLLAYVKNIFARRGNN